MDHNDGSAIQSLLGKLLLAGWISGSGFLEKPIGASLRVIGWTDKGLQAASAIGLLVEELESESERLSGSELLQLHALIRDQGEEARSR